MVEENKNVRMMMGDYKVAVRKMAWPMILSMLITMSYNLIDGIWVSVLGAAPLAAVGFVTPLFMVVNGLANGLGAGASSFIARKIGAKRKDLADLGTSQSFLIGIIIPIIISVFILLFQKSILIGLGASGEVLSLALDYSTVIFSGCIFIVITSILTGVLRAEGDVKRALYVMALTAVINIILDPVFMLPWGLNLGVAGIAYATVLSSGISAVVILYWMLIKRDTYLNIYKRDLKPNGSVIKDILMVGIPAALEMMCIAALLSVVNSVLTMVADNNAVAAYTAGMRVVLFGIVPSVGLSMATIAVAGSSFGAGKFRRLKNVLNYSMKLGILMSVAIGAVVFIFSSQIATVFSFSSNTGVLIEPISNFLKVFFLFFLATPLGLLSGSFFQSLGKGPTSLCLTIFREIIFPAFFVVLLGIVLGYGVWGVWFGVVIGKLAGALIGWFYASNYSSNLIKKYGDEELNP